MRRSDFGFLVALTCLTCACSNERRRVEPLPTTAGTTPTPTRTPTPAPSVPPPAVPTSPERGPHGPARNSFLAADTYALTHFDPAQTDSMPYAAKRGTFHANLRRAPRVDHGPINILTAASTSHDFMWAISSEGVAYVDVTNGGFREVARLAAPGVKSFPPGTLERALGRRFTSAAQVSRVVRRELGLDWTRIGNGVYSVVDRDNHVYFNTFGGHVVVFALEDADHPSSGIHVLKSRDLRGDILHEGEAIAGLNMTYDGRLIVLGSNSISVLDRNLDVTLSTIRLGADERVTNAAAVDERNGIYVASDKRMHKVVWTGTRLSSDESDGAWSAPYDQGRQPPTVKIGTGTGSTPTLVGFGSDPDKLVVITDGADRMKLVAFWRDTIPADAAMVPGASSRRIAGQIQVTCGLPADVEFLQSEQSVVTRGYGAFVVNNIAKKAEGDLLVGVVALGPVNEPAKGVERFEWDPGANRFRSVWTRNDVVSTSMVPAVSVPSGIVFVNGYTRSDGWEVTGLDWNTGETVHRTMFGQDNLGNGAYAILQLFPNGDLLFNGIAGPTRVAM